MNPLLTAVSAVIGIGGVMTLGAGFARVHVDRAKPTAAIRRKLHRIRGDSPAQRRRRATVAASVGAGAIVWLVTGWTLAIIAIPAGVLVLPTLMQISSAKREIARIEAMSEWTRDLSGVLGVGIGIEQALTTSLTTAPEPIRTEVAHLVARIDARWPVEQALRKFADELDDATGDLIAAALILGAQRRGDQLSKVLEALADTVAEDVRIRRHVDADQAKLRSTARMVTGILTTILGGMLLTPYADPYRTPAGQIILAALLAAYVGCLLWLRRATATPRQARILGNEARLATGASR